MDQINDVFADVIKETGIDPFELKRARLREEWEEIAGEDLSNHLSIRTLDGDTLILQATDPSWSHQASMMTSKIRNSINEHFDEELVANVTITH